MLMSGRCAAVPGASCPKPEWPRDALRYELDGTTTLRYAVGEDGRATSAVVEKSSGWMALDVAALNNLAGCVFKAPTPEGVTMPTQYVWRLDEERPLRPLLVRGSCQASDRFETFKNLDKSRSNASGIVLRMFISSEGSPWSIVAEAEGIPQEPLDAAIAYIQTCRFAIDPDVAGRRINSTYGRLQLKNW